MLCFLQKWFPINAPTLLKMRVFLTTTIDHPSTWICMSYVSFMPCLPHVLHEQVIHVIHVTHVMHVVDMLN